MNNLFSDDDLDDWRNAPASWVPILQSPSEQPEKQDKELEEKSHKKSNKPKKAKTPSKKGKEPKTSTQGKVPSKKGQKFEQWEDKIILDGVSGVNGGNRWAQIASRLPGRSRKSVAQRYGTLTRPLQPKSTSTVPTTIDREALTKEVVQRTLKKDEMQEQVKQVYTAHTQQQSKYILSSGGNDAGKTRGLRRSNSAEALLSSPRPQPVLPAGRLPPLPDLLQPKPVTKPVPPLVEAPPSAPQTTTTSSTADMLAQYKEKHERISTKRKRTKKAEKEKEKLALWEMQKAYLEAEKKKSPLEEMKDKMMLELMRGLLEEMKEERSERE